MQRFLFWFVLCLPICLLVAPDRFRPIETPPPLPAAEPADEPTFAVVADDGSPLPDMATMERLARTNPCAFLEWCVRRCQRELKAARLVLHKHERINGEQRAAEIIGVDYQVDPQAVLFHWKEGAGLAGSVLYCPADLPDKLLVRPAGLLAVGGNVEREVRGEEARQSGRYTLDEFGFAMSMRRTLGSWRRAARQNGLHVEYLGIQKCPELGGRSCFVLHRTRYLRPEDKDSVTELKIYVDCETWLQTGSILKNGRGEILGQYYFNDVQRNPEFKPGRFTPKGLRQPPPSGI